MPQADLQTPRLLAADPARWPVAADWAPMLEPYWASAAWCSLRTWLEQRLAAGVEIYPSEPLRALALTPLATVRVVILGQDPYHGPGQAEGLAFSVPAGVRPPPSLRNIHKELRRTHGPAARLPDSLSDWARQGVLLLNAVLTVEREAPASHARRGWEGLTDALIRACSQDPRPKVFVLWGAHAQAKAALVDASRHLVLQSNHPSPLSATRGPAPFIGCSHFETASRWLADHGQTPVRWVL